MPDQRSVMKEFRSLEQKRASEGLTPSEAARHAQLRELIGPETGAGGLKGGFDVNAAAARLRESLLPAGLRNRPPPTPAQPEPEAEPELAQEPSAADALAGQYEAEPFTPLGAGEGGDALFDPASLGLDALPADESVVHAEWGAGLGDAPDASSGSQGGMGAGWDPQQQAYGETPGYDPQQPYGEAAGWDAQQPYDPAPGGDAHAGAWDAPAAEGQPYEAAPGAAWEDPASGAGDAAWDPNAPVDPGAEPAWDPNAPVDRGAEPAWDPNAPVDSGAEPAWDPNAPVDSGAEPAWDPNAPVDPGADPAWDPNAPVDPGAGPAWDPNAPVDPGADPAWDPNAPVDPGAGPAWDPNSPLDPGAQAAWDAGRPSDPYAGLPLAEDGAATVDPSAEATWDPSALATWETDAAAGEAAQDLGARGEGPDGAAPVAYGEWDAAAEAADAPVTGDDAGPFDAGDLLVETDAGPVGGQAPRDADPGGVGPDGWEVAAPLAEPPPADAPLGEYDEIAPGLPAGEDAGLESALPLEPGLEGQGAPVEAPALGEYDDTAGFGGGFPDVAPADLPVEGGGFEAAGAFAPAAPAGWDPEPAVDEGFLLESGGSFDAADAAVVPEWAGGGELPWDAAAGPPGAIAPPPGDAPSDDTSFEVDFGDPPAPAPSDAPPADLATAPDAAPDLALDAEAHAPDLSGPPPALDFSRPDLSEGRPDDDLGVPYPGASAGPDDVAADDDIPTIDGEEILEEIPVEELVPAGPLDFEPHAESTASVDGPGESAPLAEAAIPPEPSAPEPPPPALVPPAPPAAPPRGAPGRRVEGVHRVVVHTVEGQARRGVLEEPDLAAASLDLAPQPGAAAERVATDGVKAIFFMLAPGERPPAPDGKRVRITFRDGRQIAGFSPDYDETGAGFFLVPADTRTNTGRIWVYRASVKHVAVG